MATNQSCQLLARALLWRWLARAWWYPDTAFLAELNAAARRRELDATAAACGDAAVAAAVAAVWAGVDAGPEGAAALAGEHTYLFARQVQVPPHETRYAVGRGADRAQRLSEIGGYYAAFGFQVAAEHPELPDHLSVECAFVAALLAKEVYAREQAWGARARLVRTARHKFLSEHLAAWLPEFAGRLAEHSRLPFYPAVAALADVLIALERLSSAATATAPAAAHDAGQPS